jgi:hypothetical protein
MMASKKSAAKREGAGLGVYRINAALRAGFTGIFGRAKSQVSSPDLDFKLAVEEYRRHCSPATQVEYSHFRS